MTFSIGNAPNFGAILFGILLSCLLASGKETLVRVKREDKLIVTTILNTPYYTKSGDSHEGYIVDLMQKIKEKTNLTFQFSPVADGKFGSQSADGTWDGMVGEVVDGKASIAAAPLTVTDQRKSVLDFTVPFMTVNLSLILLKPHGGEIKIHNVKELTEQTNIKCGIVESGSTFMFFNSTQDPLFQKLNQMILSDPNNLVFSYEEGIKKVRTSSGRFGMITESSTAEYHSGQMPCDLVAVNLINYNRSYALAVKKGSQVKATLDSALEQLKSGGHASELERLKQKWWKSECSSGSSIGVEFHSLPLMVLVVSLASLVGSV